MAILILNWPHETFNLGNQICLLEPPVGIFPSIKFPSQPQAICEWNDMLEVFSKFSSSLLRFIIQNIIKHFLNQIPFWEIKLQYIPAQRDFPSFHFNVSASRTASS